MWGEAHNLSRFLQHRDGETLHTVSGRSRQPLHHHTTASRPAACFTFLVLAMFPGCVGRLRGLSEPPQQRRKKNGSDCGEAPCGLHCSRLFSCWGGLSTVPRPGLCSPGTAAELDVWTGPGRVGSSFRDICTQEEVNLASGISDVAKYRSHPAPRAGMWPPQTYYADGDRRSQRFPCRADLAR